MMQKIVILFLFFTLQSKSQNSTNIDKIADNFISDQLYTKCFENLNQGSDFFNKYPSFKSMKFCSLIECSWLLSYKEPEIQQVAKERLIGIATQLFREGTPVILIKGLDSYLTTQKSNENFEDDNHIIYISYGDCIGPKFLDNAAEIVNRRTMQLLKN